MERLSVVGDVDDEAACFVPLAAPSHLNLLAVEYANRFGQPAVSESPRKTVLKKCRSLGLRGSEGSEEGHCRCGQPASERLSVEA